MERQARREWLGGTALLGATLATRGLARETTAPDGFVDAHVHVWTPDTARFPLATGFTVADMQPPSFTAAELLATCRPMASAAWSSSR